MKNAIYIIIAVALIAGVFFLGRWAGRSHTAVDAVVQTSEELAGRGYIIAEHLRSAERQNRHLESLVDELRAENKRAIDILRNIESDNSTITAGSQALESGLGEVADTIADIIAELQAREN